MKKILFIMIMLINSITTSSQNSEHVYHFDFDGRCVPILESLKNGSPAPIVLWNSMTEFLFYN